MSEQATELLTRVLPCEVRGIDEDKRTAEFVASTEQPVEMAPWLPPEVLRMSGVQLARFRSNPIVLDNHRVYGPVSDVVIGSAKVWKEGRELHCRIAYADTAKGLDTWKLVRDGHVRAVSVGYRVLSVREIGEGEFDGDGEGRVEGPALIATKWLLREISQTTIPADSKALRRSADFYQRVTKREDSDMAIEYSQLPDPSGRNTPAQQQPPATTQPAQAPAPAQQPAEQRTQPQEGGQVIRLADLTPEEIRARNDAARVQQIKALTPTGLEHVAHRSILAGHSVDEARAELLKAYTEQNKPAGTPEAAPIDYADGQEDARGASPAGGNKKRDLTADEVVRSLKRS